MSELRVLQNEVAEWADRNFTGEKPHQPLLGLGEETGELMHAHLKGEQGIRHTKGEIYKMKKDAVGDIFIFLAHYCHLNNLDLQDCIEQTWQQVQKRDWTKNKVDGVDGFKPFGSTLGELGDEVGIAGI